MAQRSAEPRPFAQLPIAIVGIGCRFPGGADSPDAYWRLLTSGVDAVGEIPPGRFDVNAFYDPDPGAPGKMYTRSGSFLDGIDTFDASFFGISPREASCIDPQQRLLLETVWEAFEDAGQPPHLLAGTKAGVFVGISGSDYGDYGSQDLEHADGHMASGSALSIAANRVSFCLDLRGPSYSVDTACSSSLTAVHLACRSLNDGECDIAVAGGVNVLLNPDIFIGFCKAGMLSPDGRCKAFDAKANGFVRGEGCGIVLLKPLAKAVENGDSIYAVIRGTAANQDGRTAGLTVPSGEAQEALIWQALAQADAVPTDVQYMEAHGTGTAVGDPIEATAIGRVLSVGRNGAEPCVIGSSKTNLGHLESAAGAAGLIKVALALKHRRIPPHLHFDRPNPAIPLEELRLRVPTALEPWPATSGRVMAGVNSFGFGGANAHVLVEAAPPVEETRAEPTRERSNVLLLSARDPGALKQLAKEYLHWFDANPSVTAQDVCHTSAVRRTHHEHRLAVVGRNRDDLVEQLDAFAAGQRRASVVSGACSRSTQPKLAFVYSGMGPQWWGMGRQLMQEEPRFLKVLEECDRLLLPLSGWSLLAELSMGEAESRITDADRSHVANFALQTALTALWRSWGIVPDAIVGHSTGEMAAAHAAGILDLPSAIRLAFHRGRLQHRATDTGKMLAVAVSPDAVAEFMSGFEDRVSLAAVNSPTSVTLSGDAEALDRIAMSLDQKGMFCRPLPVRVPYHGPLMDPIRAELLESLDGLQPAAAMTPMASSVTGHWLEGPEVDAKYWWSNVRQPVLFADAMKRVLGAGHEVFVEVGPHPVLAASIAECLTGKAGVILPTLKRTESDRDTMLKSLAALYAHGRGIDWAGVFDRGGSYVRLPTYPWQRERHWRTPAAPKSQSHPVAGVDTGHPLLGRRIRAVLPTWEGSLDQPGLAYLLDHSIEGTALAPGAAYVEMALAASRELSSDSQALCVERVTFHKPLFLGPGGSSLTHFRYDKKTSSFEIHGAAAGDEPSWTLHASGTLGKPPATAPAPLDMEQIKARCTEKVSLPDWLRVIRGRGYDFGPAFQCIEEFWKGDGEGLVRIRLPAAAGPADRYVVHPSLLDAAFQAIGMFPTSDHASHAWGLELPVSVGRVSLHAAVQRDLWVYVSMLDRRTGAMSGNAAILEGDGTVVLTVDRLEDKTITPSQESIEEDLDDLLYDCAWETRPLDAEALNALGDRVDATDLAKGMRPVTREVADRWRWTQYRAAHRPRLDRLAAELTRAAIREMGYDGDPSRANADELADRLGVVSAHRKYFARLLDNLLVSAHEQPTATESVPPRQLASALVAERADSHSLVELLLHVGERLPRILRGELDPREVLFAPEALAALEIFYSEFTGTAYYQSLIGEVLARASAESPGSRKLRVLEIGGGTGGATDHVVSKLSPQSCEYHFTDLSAFFITRAKKKYRNAEFMRFGVFDVERVLSTQQIAPHSFDVVLATNVLHATRDIRSTLANVRRLLAPGGLLVLGETTARNRWPDLIFGTTEGWWLFGDHDVRPTHPLLSPAGWRTALRDAGFEAPVAVEEDCEESEATGLVLLANTSRSMVLASDSTTPPPGRSWLVFADRRGIGKTVATRLRDRGDECVLVFPGESYRECDRQTFEARPDDAAAITTILRGLAGESAAIHGVLHFWGLDAPATPALTTATLMDAQRLVCSSVLATVRALDESAVEPAEAWFVTAGAQHVGDENASLNVAQAPLWGLGRSLAAERKKIRCRLVDLSDVCAPEEIDALVRELDAGEPEEGLAYRRDRRFVSRIRRTSVAAEASPQSARRASPATTAFRLEMTSPGLLETLRLREFTKAALRPGEVAIRPVAAGVNFRDVLLSLGMLGLPEDGRAIGPPEELGFECSGVVLECGEGVNHVRPGDEVVASAWNAFASRTTTLGDLVVRKPQNLTSEEAATVPVAFLTAYYGLITLAKLGAGERVLIHLGTGGVGLAAIQIARWIGAEIFATAGSAEKRSYLKSLGVEHVMDSRSLDFADDIMRITSGQGVDVILNSLGGEAIQKGLSVLRTFGRFVEIGKRDIYENSSIGMFPFHRDLTFRSFDLTTVVRERPAEVGAVLRELARLLAGGVLRPLPHTDFDLSHAEDAFRFIAQAKHIGKVVITMRDEEYPVLPSARAQLFRPDATYLVVGGLGGFGAVAAEWMVEQGARHLVLMSRSGTPVPESRATIAALQQSDALVVVMRGDVTVEADVARVLEQIDREGPPLRGVVHTAMLIDDDMLEDLDEARLHAVLIPKLAGSWNLHTLTLDRELDYFVLFSSVTSVWGNLRQGNYSAANAFLDGLAAHRRAQGRTALAVSWGGLSDMGYMADRPDVAQYSDRQGLTPMESRKAIRALGRALPTKLAHIVAARVDWDVWWSLDPALAPLRTSSRRCEYLAVESTPKVAEGDESTGRASILHVVRAAPRETRLSILQDYVAQNAAKVLGTSVDRVDRNRALTDMGFDSLMAVELANLMSRDLGVQFAVVKVLKGATINLLGEGALAELKLDSATEAAEPRSKAEAESRVVEGTIEHAVEHPSPATQPLEQHEVDGEGVAGVTLDATTRASLHVVEPVRAEPVVEGNGHRHSSAPSTPRAWSPLQRVAQKTLAAMFAMAARVEVVGAEHIPLDGPCVLVGNHLSLMDTPLLFTLMPRKCVLLAASDLSPLLRRVLDPLDTIYVRRGEADLQALDRGLDVLRGGGMIGLGPEGTRSRAGGLGIGRTGAAYLALRAGAPILPVVCYGQERLPPNLRRLKRTDVVVRFGALIHLTPGEVSAAKLREDTESMMTVLATMLPESYRGIYASRVDSVRND